ALGGKGVPVGHEYFAGVQELAVLRGNEIEDVVVVVMRVRAQNLQSFLHRQVWCSDENRIRELRGRWIPPPVAERPGDEHRHDDRLPASRRHLAPQPPQWEGGRI